MKKKILLIIVLLGLVGIGTAVYMYNKPHRNIQEEKAVFKGDAQKLYNTVLADRNYYETEILDQTVEITGMVTNKESNTFTIAPGFLCSLDSTVNIDLINQGEISVKGRIVGIEVDDIFDETFVRMDYCKPI